MSTTKLVIAALAVTSIPVTASESLAIFVEEFSAQIEAPGLSAAVRYPDGRIETAVAGFADVEARTPMTARTRLQGGSTGKTFVAALTMLLVEDGVLALDDPLSRWLGEEIWFDRLPNARSITLSHLLSHSAGLRDHVHEPDFALGVAWHQWTQRESPMPVVQEIGYILDEAPLFAPGQGYSYTDTGYLLLGLVIERATGRDYYALLTERILTPLALTDVRPANTRAIDGLAAGYSEPTLLTRLGRVSGKLLDDEGHLAIHPLIEWTGGGLATTPTMLVEFYAALATGRIVRPPSFALMMSAGYRQSGGSDDHYGYGLSVSTLDGRRAIGHGGFFPGYRTYALHLVDDRLTIAVQTNTDRPVDPTPVRQFLARLARAP